MRCVLRVEYFLLEMVFEGDLLFASHYILFCVGITFDISLFVFLLIKYVEKNKYLHSWVLKFQPIYVVMRDKGEQTVTPAYDINKEICYVTHRVGIILSSYQQQFPSTQ